MLLIEKETGEICELCIKSVGDYYVNTGLDGVFPLGDIAIIGNIETEVSSRPIQERFEILGVL